MNTSLVIIGVLFVAFVAYFLTKNNYNKTQQFFIARQITIEQFENILVRLEKKELEYDFFGITSNGVDCIYFMNEEGIINIDFEVMLEDQKYYVDKIQDFAKKYGHNVVMTTYGNKPHYDDLSEAPVVHVETYADIESAADIGRRIMEEVFNHDKSTTYKVIP